MIASIGLIAARGSAAPAPHFRAPVEI